MTDCEVEEVVSRHKLTPSIMKRNFSDTFVSIIEDYSPEKDQEKLEEEFELSGCNNTSDDVTIASTNEARPEPYNENSKILLWLKVNQCQVS